MFTVWLCSSSTFWDFWHWTFCQLGRPLITLVLGPFKGLQKIRTAWPRSDYWWVALLPAPWAFSHWVGAGPGLGLGPAWPWGRWLARIGSVEPSSGSLQPLPLNGLPHPTLPPPPPPLPQPFFGFSTCKKSNLVSSGFWWSFQSHPGFPYHNRKLPETKSAPTSNWGLPP